MVGLDSASGLETHELEGRLVEFLDFGYVVLFEEDLLVTKRVEEPKGWE